MAYFRLAMVKLPNSEIDDLASLGDFVEFEIIEKLSHRRISEITFRGGEKRIESCHRYSKIG